MTRQSLYKRQQLDVWAFCVLRFVTKSCVMCQPIAEEFQMVCGHCGIADPRPAIVGPQWPFRRNELRRRGYLLRSTRKSKPRPHDKDYDLWTMCCLTWLYALLGYALFDSVVKESAAMWRNAYDKNQVRHGCNTNDETQTSIDKWFRWQLRENNKSMFSQSHFKEFQTHFLHHISILRSTTWFSNCCYWHCMPLCGICSSKARLLVIDWSVRRDLISVERPPRPCQYNPTGCCQTFATDTNGMCLSCVRELRTTNKMRLETPNKSKHWWIQRMGMGQRWDFVSCDLYRV